MYNNGMKTCVLISTAGSLLNHNYGPFIDGHDVVIRTGQSPIRGYESHVGSKTTYRIMSVSLFDPHYNIDIHNFVKNVLRDEIIIYSHGNKVPRCRMGRFHSKYKINNV